MLEDIAKKREIVRKITEELKEVYGDHERFKEVIDKAYIASLEQSLAIANEINFIKDSLRKKEIPEYYKKYLEKMINGLRECYNFSAMELRLLTIAGQRYGLTNAPED